MMIHEFNKIKELIKFSWAEKYNDDYLTILIDTDDMLPIGEGLSFKEVDVLLRIVIKDKDVY